LPATVEDSNATQVVQVVGEEKEKAEEKGEEDTDIFDSKRDSIVAILNGEMDTTLAPASESVSAKSIDNFLDDLFDSDDDEK
jgi:hypothetical protein